MPRMIAVHPGEILKTEYLEPLDLTPRRLARDLHVSAPTVNDIVRGRRAITAEMALRLARFFGTSAELWMGLQAEFDRRVAVNKLKGKLEAIVPLSRQVA